MGSSKSAIRKVLSDDELLGAEDIRERVDKDMLLSSVRRHLRQMSSRWGEVEIVREGKFNKYRRCS